MAKKSLLNCPETPRIDKRFLWIVFLISFFLGSFFAFCFRHPLVADAIEYDTIGWNLAQGNGFSSQDSAPYVPTMQREPVYPYILGTIYKIFGHKYGFVYIFQISILSLTCILVYFLTRNIFGEKEARYSAVFTAICPTLANYPSYILTETLFTFLLCLSILALTRAAKAQRGVLFLASGAILGITVLCKVMMFLFLFIVLLGVILLKKDWKTFFKKRISHLAIFGLAFLIVISPWVYRNFHVFGYAHISLRGGAALWEVAYKLDTSFEDMKKAVVFNFSEYLGNLLFPGLVDSPRDFILMRSKKSHARESQLRQQNFNPVEIDNIMRKEALKKIRSHRNPFLKLLAHVPLELIKMTAFLYIPTLNETHIINKFNKLRNGRQLLSGIRGLIRLAAYPLIILAIMGVWFERKLWHSWYFSFAVIIYTNLIYSLLFGLGRYAVPLIPFYLIFASARISRLKLRFIK